MPRMRELNNSPEQEWWEKEEEVEEETSEEEYEEEDLSEVESRLEEANCYKALLRAPLFGPDSPAIAEQVEAKVKDFIRNELGVLLGLHAPKEEVVARPELFDEDEVRLLKTWAGVLKGRPHLMNSKPTEPQVNTATVEKKSQEIQVARVAKAPSVNKPSTNTRTKKPKAKKEPKSPNQKIVTHVINGVTVEHDVNKGRPTRPSPNTPGYIPPLDPESSAMYYERNAAINAPQGLIALAATAASNLGDE